MKILLVALLACGGGEDDGDETGEGDATAPRMTATAMEHGNDIIGLLDAGVPVFGMFAPEQSAAGGVAAAQDTRTDFIFYSLESGPWDIPTLESFMAAMQEAGAGKGGAHPVVLRIPPIRDDREAARRHLSEGLAAGVDGLVLPHVESVDDVALAAEVVGDRLWPVHADGDVINVVLIEDQVGIERAREIVGAPGVGVAIPGPGDLRRAYDGDMDAVERAIQTVLAACQELDVPCGITAGPDDITERLAQGFEMIIVTRPEALALGLEASGRGG
ncbi:MAG: aldolase/citrate lyase family protein [Longimicrobiales bacterium]|nr:aldolase/citrate lyase family protein [Longimicrobiales bacterium]